VVFLTVLAVKEGSFTGCSIEESRKRSKECTGFQGSEDSGSTKFKGYLKFGGVFALGLKN